MLFLSFLASLSPLAFLRPIYIFVGPMTHCSCRLGLMGFFAIYPVNSLWPSSLGSSVYWASTNGPQQVLFHKVSKKCIYWSPNPLMLIFLLMSWAEQETTSIWPYLYWLKTTANYGHCTTDDGGGAENALMYSLRFCFQKTAQHNTSINI